MDQASFFLIGFGVFIIGFTWFVMTHSEQKHKPENDQKN